jgi:hypothetical protein
LCEESVEGEAEAAEEIDAKEAVERAIDKVATS